MWFFLFCKFYKKICFIFFCKYFLLYLHHNLVRCQNGKLTHNVLGIAEGVALNHQS